MLVKFEQNRMVQTTRNFDLFDKKQTNKTEQINKKKNVFFLKTIFDKTLTPLMFLKLKQLIMLNY